MNLTKTQRGFGLLLHPRRNEPEGGEIRLLQESSVIGDYPDSFDKTGSSCLWVGADHELNREEVTELVEHLQRWLATGKFRKETT